MWKKGGAGASGGTDFESQAETAVQAVEQAAAVLAFHDTVFCESLGSEADGDLATGADAVLHGHYASGPVTPFADVVLAENLD